MSLQFVPVPLATLCLALRAVEAETGVFQGNLLAVQRRSARFVVARRRLWQLLRDAGYSPRAISEVCCVTDRQVSRAAHGPSASWRASAAVLERRAKLEALPAGTSTKAAALATGIPVRLVKCWRQWKASQARRPMSADGLFRANRTRTRKQSAA